MTCDDTRSLFTDYLDGRVSGALRREIEAHIKSCPTCAGKLRGVRLIRNRLLHLERKRLPDTFAFGVRRMLLEEASREASWWAKLRDVRWPMPQIAWSAAVGSFVAVASFAVLWFAVAPSTPTGAGHAGTIAADSMNQRQSVRYVLEHLPLEGEAIESTAKDTASQPVTPSAPIEAQPVSASF